MTITEAHKIAASVAGEMALSIGRRDAPADALARWVKMLRSAADGLERRAAIYGQNTQ